MNKALLSVCASAACGSLATAQFPGNVNLQFASTALGGAANVALINNQAYDSTASWNGSNVRTNFGLNNFTSNKGPFQMYMVQMQASLPAAPTAYSTVALTDVPDAPPSQPSMGPVKAALVQDLYNRYYASVSTSVQARAFQIAILEITGERWTAPGAFTTAAQIVAQIRTVGFNTLEAGQFRARSTNSVNVADMAAVYSQAMTYLLGLGGVSGTSFRSAAILGLTSGSAQDQLLLVPIGAPGIIAGLGLVGVVALRRRRK